MQAPHINDLRKHLLDTLADLRNRESPMEPDRARAVAAVASVLVDTAKVEVEYLRVTEQKTADFLAGGERPQQITHTPTGTVEEFPGVRRHKLR